MPRRTRDITRNQSIITLAEAGETYADLATRFNVSRQRVHQIVRHGSTLSAEDLTARRATRRTLIAEQQHTMQVQQVRDAATADPQATISDLAHQVGVSRDIVLDALPFAEQQRRNDPQERTSTPDDEALAEITRVAALPGGTPLSGAFYDTHRAGGLSRSRLLQRYGTWSAACKSAGVTPQQPPTGRVYTSRWTREDVLGFVWQYLSQTGTPTFADFEHWLRDRPDLPSAQTVRNLVGTWSQMRREASDRFGTPAL